MSSMKTTRALRGGHQGVTSPLPTGLAQLSPELGDALRSAVGEPGQVRDRSVDRLALAHDASHYSLVPLAVVAPRNPGEVGRLLAVSATHGVPLTFRAGGTSLSGQSSTSGVLVDVRRHFRTVEVLDGGALVKVQPGATVRQVNTRLAPFGRKLGPDPASEGACTLGGVVANNSSGMACGTVQNTYATMRSMVLVLPTGTVVDTGASDADERLRVTEPDLHEGLLRLRDRVRSEPGSVRRIRQLFSMKNTMGYGVNAFLDFDSAAQILAHLMVGSEGTLGFVAEVTFETVPLLQHAQTGLLVFADLEAATASLPALVATGAATLELMDATSLRVGQKDPAANQLVRAIPVDRHAALLVEYQSADPLALAEACDSARPVLAGLPLTAPAALTGDAATRASLWHLRKGLYATVAGDRPSGTTALLEDVVVPVADLLDTCIGLTGLFERHAYRDSVIFGHAKDGNIHFMLNEHFGAGGDPERYHRFTGDMVELILGNGGSLKAEHGTGRMMAPFVRRQYGDELYEVMRQIKRLCDPTGLLNPGVIIEGDPEAYGRNLKVTPSVEEEIDRCVDCGFCEPVCPSKDLTTTPRQRIALRRALARARSEGNQALVAELESAQKYDVVDTCAADGMCQTACPVSINTGDLVRRLRKETASPVKQKAWKAAARHWAGATTGASTGLTMAASLPAVLTTAATRLARSVAGADTMPLWTPDLPPGGSRRPLGPSPSDRSTTDPRPGTGTAVSSPSGAGPSARSSDRAAVGPDEAPKDAGAVLFAACVGTMFGPAAGGQGASSALRTLCDRVGITLVVPAGLPSLCCGTPWKSKGMAQGYAVMRDRVIPALWEASRGGELPIVCDASSCTEGLHELLRSAADDHQSHRLQVLDAVDFVQQHVLEQLHTSRWLSSVAVHPTCSSTRLGTTAALEVIAATFTNEVVVPPDWGCCGFAGDRGLLHPELTASATAPEVAGLGGRQHAAYISSNRTCELGMSRATGHQYRHVLEVLEEVTRARKAPPMEVA
jgi:D-lactate dehydrogenase